MAGTRRSVANLKDPKKESQIRELAAGLQSRGFVVRREKLRQGPGWKVISGACRALGSKYIFVDPRMPQDDQIVFLKSRLDQVLAASGEGPAVSGFAVGGASEAPNAEVVAEASAA